MLGSDSLITNHGTTLHVLGPADVHPVEVPELVGAGHGAVDSSADGTQLYLLTDWPADPEQELVTEGQRAASSLSGVTVLDDLATRVPVSGPARRVVSLVPSLTESVATTRPAALIGATDWCTHPTGLTVVRVRGTKNPDIAAIIALTPDLVIANKEENRPIDVHRLRDAGVPVWVTVIETVPQAIDSLTRLFADGLCWGVPGWLADIRAAWAQPVPDVRARVAVPIWRDPWMVVGRDTFTGDLLRRRGYHNVFADHPDRYPTVALAEIDRADVDLVLLPDEPYPFAAADGPEAFTTTHTTLVNGRLLTWYGPSLLEAATFTA